MTALESGELSSQHERELRCSEGSGMLIVTLYGEGSNASSTNNKSVIFGNASSGSPPSGLAYLSLTRASLKVVNPTVHDKYEVIVYKKESVRNRLNEWSEILILFYYGCTS